MSSAPRIQIRNQISNLYFFVLFEQIPLFYNGQKMEFIPYKANECFEHLYYQIPMKLFFNIKYKDKLNSDSKILLLKTQLN